MVKQYKLAMILAARHVVTVPEYKGQVWNRWNMNKFQPLIEAKLKSLERDGTLDIEKSLNGEHPYPGYTKEFDPILRFLWHDEELSQHQTDPKLFLMLPARMRDHSNLFPLRPSA